MTDLAPRVIAQKESVTSLAVDPIRRKLFWFNYDINSIMRANFDGTSKEIVMSFTKFLSVFGMHVEPISKMLYIGDMVNNLIIKVDFSGQHLQVLAKGEDIRPHTLVIDFKRG